ncbi:hypothetical protein K523DRAFT_326877, partial [Schizophyllum commune Tattone D]
MSDSTRTTLPGVAGGSGPSRPSGSEPAAPKRSSSRLPSNASPAQTRSNTRGANKPSQTPGQTSRGGGSGGGTSRGGGTSTPAGSSLKKTTSATEPPAPAPDSVTKRASEAAAESTTRSAVSEPPTTIDPVPHSPGETPQVAGKAVSAPGTPTPTVRVPADPSRSGNTPPDIQREEGRVKSSSETAVSFAVDEKPGADAPEGAKTTAPSSSSPRPRTPSPRPTDHRSPSTRIPSPTPSLSSLARAPSAASSSGGSSTLRGLKNFLSTNSDLLRPESFESATTALASRRDKGKGRAVPLPTTLEARASPRRVEPTTIPVPAVEDDEPITVKVKNDPFEECSSRIFRTRTMKWNGLRNEPLHVSVLRYHNEPSYDVFAKLGLEGVPSELPVHLRLIKDAYIRFMTPHKELVWEGSLQEELIKIARLEITRSQVEKMDYYEEESSDEGSSASENEDGYEPVVEKGKPWYSLSAAMLDRLGHAVLATEQIINALALAGDNDNTETHFHYDRDFKKLRLLEVGKGRAQVVSVAAVLCARATSARNHIAAFFGVLQAASRNGPPDSDLAVSTDIVSTVTELRCREGKEPLSAELAKYYARPAYARAIAKVAPKYADHLRENLKAGRVDVPDIVARTYSLPAYATAEIREAVRRGADENKVHYRTGLLKFDKGSGVSRLAPPEASTKDPLPAPIERGEEGERIAETRTVTRPSRTEVRPTRVQERSAYQASKPSQREERERKQRREYEALSRLGGAPGTSLPVLPGGPLSAAVLTRNAPSRASSLAPEDSVSQVEVGGPSITMSREVAASSTRLCMTPLPITLGAPWEGRKSVAVMTALREEVASLVAKVENGNGRRRAILLPDDPRRPPQDRRGEEADNPPMEETRVVATLMLATGDEVVGHLDAVEAEVVTRTTMVQAEEEADGEEGTPAEEAEAEDLPEAILSLAPVEAGNDIEYSVKTTLNLSDLPSWDGRDIITYFSRITRKAALGKMMRRQMARLLPQLWTGEAEQWFIALPVEDRMDMTRSLGALLRRLRKRYLTHTWIQQHTYEFENMRFRQKGQEKESPENFIRRRYRFSIFLYPDALDGPTVVGRLLTTAPYSWKTHIHESFENCNTVGKLMDE